MPNEINKTMRQKVEEVAETQEAEVLLLDGFDDCLLGVSLDQFKRQIVAVYSYPKIIAQLQKQDGMSQADAYEHFEFNIIGGWLGEGTPLFLDTLENWDA